MKPNHRKNSEILANLLILSEDRPLSELELQTLRVITERSQIEEIERSISLTLRSRSNASLRGQLLKDKPTYLSPKFSKVKKPQRKRGYTDKGTLADENSKVLRLILDESLIYLPELSERLPLFSKKLFKFARSEWFSIGDWEDFLIFLREEYSEVLTSDELSELEELFNDQLDHRLQHPYQFRNMFLKKPQ